MFNKISLHCTAAVAAATAAAGTAVAFTLQRTTQVPGALPRPQVGGHFTLSTFDGRTVTEAGFWDRWLYIYLGYSFCADVCPATLMSTAKP